MAIDDVLTNRLIYQWNESSRQLLVLDATQEPPRTIAKIDYATLEMMSWPEASKFIGEFVTLLVPTLRTRYSSEFADAKESASGTDA